jgi:hypothetical protein
VVLLPLLLVTWDVAVLWSADDDSLVDICGGYNDRYALQQIVLPRDSACSYFIYLRDPDPNTPLGDRPGQSVFGYVLVNHTVNGATNESGSLAILKHLLRRGVDWEQSHHPSFPPPLYLAINDYSPDLVRRLLDAGADPRTKDDRDNALARGLDTYDLARVLRREIAQRTGSPEALRSHDEMMFQAMLKIERLVCDDDTVRQHAAVGPQKVNFDPATHQLLPTDALADYAVYPADNYDVLQGVVRGPIGDHSSASLQLVGVWDYENLGLPCVPVDPKNPSDCVYDPRKAEAPSRLEAVLVVPGDSAVDGDLGWTQTIKLESRRSTEQQEARLLSLDSLSIMYSEKTDEYEVWTQARFALGCHGTPYTEGFNIRVHGRKLSVAPRISDALGLSDAAGTAEQGSKDALTKLLHRGLTPPKCSNPILPVPAQAPTQETVRSWLIHSAGVGKLSADGPLPSWLLKREKKTLKALLSDGIPADHYKAMEQGYVDQDGYRVISPSSLDLKIRFSHKQRIMVLYPGKKLRTAEGTGLGSTLGELLGAHGGFTMTNWPEPYRCGVHVPGLEGVSFAFASCDEACAGGKVQRVSVRGKDPWGEGRSDKETKKEK